MTDVLISIQGTVVVYLFFGFFLKKRGLIEVAGMQFLSTFILDFILPINVFYACTTSFTHEGIKSGIILLVIASIIEFIIFVATKFSWFKFTSDQMNIVKYGLLVSNGGLIGTPIIEGLYGVSGVMYANIFLIPTRILAYSSGENLFNPSLSRTFKSIIKNVITNKVLLATIFGIGCALLKIKIPVSISQALMNISRCLTPLSLMLVGSMLAVSTKLDWDIAMKVFVLSLARQVFIPILILCVLLQFNLSVEIITMIVLLMGMPIGSTCAIFANKYNGDEKFASISVFISTLTSTLTLVGLMSIIESILK